jgi:1-deoxy-D-xylulose-5-phosphate reductoisomerase
VVNLDKPVRLVILGSTGSIGRQALEVARAYPELIKVVALAAGSNLELLLSQAMEFGVCDIAVASMPNQPGLLPQNVRLTTGNQAVVALAGLDEADCVLNAMVGAVGLKASHAALLNGKRLALANKESLVIGGDLLMHEAAPGQLIPVDSEHSAIFQCLVGESHAELARIWLTCSGGPFRGWRREVLQAVTPEAALAHPTWKMGAKITIDSATLMNKGLELIEAMHLFDLSPEKIKVVVHPQSLVHSLVEFHDGSFKAVMGVADMRVPIQYALSCPTRWPGMVDELDLSQLGTIGFEPPDLAVFGCLRLAIDAALAGGTAPAVLNAANEVAVAAFLAGQVGFFDIERCVSTVLAGHQVETVASIEQLAAIDAEARVKAEEFLAGTEAQHKKTIEQQLTKPRNMIGQTEAEFLAGYDVRHYDRPSVTVDIVLFVRSAGEAEPGLLLIKRGNHPFIGTWALPGGFVGSQETVEQAALRELNEETGVLPNQVELRQLKVFSDPERDPRTRIITCAFVAEIDDVELNLQAGDDAAAVEVFSLDEVRQLELAGDHQQIIEYALRHSLH